MRQAGLSVSLIPLAILIVGIAFFGNHSTTLAVTHDPTTVNMTCDDQVDGGTPYWWDESCTDNITPGAIADTTTHYHITPPDSNFAFLAFGSPVDAYIANSGTVPLGAEIGGIQNKINLGLINGPCATAFDAPFTFYNAETDPANSGAAQPEGTPKRLGNLMMVDTLDDDGDGMYAEDCDAGKESAVSGLFDYYDAEDVDDDGDTDIDEDCPTVGSEIPGAGGTQVHTLFYPKFLTNIFDPDIDGSLLDPAANGPIPPTAPYARYSSMSPVAQEPISLQFLQFAPGQLAGYPAGSPFAEIGNEFGWTNMIFLNTPNAVAISSPSTISAFCADLASHVVLHGQASEDDDSTFDDTVRYRNPDDGTGLVDPATGAGTNTHLNMTLSYSYRDLDGDGVVNGDTYDTCAQVDNTAGPLADWDPTASRPQARDADSDGIPEEDTNASTVIDVDDGCDNILTVGLGKADHEAHPETEIAGACANALDDDNDGRVNDGCVTDGAPEVNQCQNNTDDDTGDGDGKVNDGCPIVIPIPYAPPPFPVEFFQPLGAEVDQCSGAGNGVDNDNDGTADDGCGGGDPPADGPPETDQCQNAKDDDKDFRVNDGCPEVGGTSEFDQCENALNDDGDGTVNDGCYITPIIMQNEGDGFTSGDDNCPIVFNPLQVESELTSTYAVATGGDGGVKSDGMGDECDLNPLTSDGTYRIKAIMNAKCIGAGITPGVVDTDSDGYCDATEIALGGSIAGTPEHLAVHPPFPAGRANAEQWGGATDGVGTACSDGIDNDGDGNTDGDDSGCKENVAGESEPAGEMDGIADAVDNCDNEYNPTQGDIDKDGVGDACDDDADGDGWNKYREQWIGSDYLDSCPNASGHDAWHADINRDKKVDVVDALGIGGLSEATTAEADMTEAMYDRRLDLTMDDASDPSEPGVGIGGAAKRQDIDVVDWLGIRGYSDNFNNTCANGSVSIDLTGDTTPELVVGENFYPGTSIGGAGSWYDRTYSVPNPDWRVQVTQSQAHISTMSYKVTCPDADEHEFDIKWTENLPPNELDIGGSHTVVCDDDSEVTVEIDATHEDVYSGP